MTPAAGGASHLPLAAYVHGVTGPVVVVPARVAAWLERHADLKRVRWNARATDPEVDAVLMGLAFAARAWRTSAAGSEPRREAEVQAPSPLMSTSQAADAIGIDARSVRQAITDGRLPAECVDGRWLIAREDVAHYRAARAARAA